jgi:hypothetical protein
MATGRMWQRNDSLHHVVATVARESEGDVQSRGAIQHSLFSQASRWCSRIVRVVSKPAVQTAVIDVHLLVTNDRVGMFAAAYDFFVKTNVSSGCLAGQKARARSLPSFPALWSLPVQPPNKLTLISVS